MPFDRRNAPSKRGGFVLVVSVMVLSVISAVLLSLGLLLRVETRLGVNREAAAQGRRNALCALDLALSHLQSAAGPDQRWTARAEVASPQALSQPYWTGVWRRDAGVPVLATWLVSGNHGSNALAVAPDSALNPLTAPLEDEVLLVDLGTVASSSQRIKLATIPITRPSREVDANGQASADTVGHFAYWIGDEGIKASLVGPANGSLLNYDNSMPGALASLGIAPGVNWQSNDGSSVRLEQMRPSCFRTDLLFPGFDAQDCASRLNRVVERGQLPMVSPALSRFRTRSLYHSITDRSRAVLLDHGGDRARLRVDLSDTPDVGDPSVKRMLLERPVSNVIPWMANHSIQRGSDPAQSSHGLGFSSGPVLTECLCRFHLYRNPADQSLWLRREVQAELWNPYSCSLSIETEPLELEITGLPEIKVSHGSQIVTVNLNDHFKILRVDRQMHWEPGEIVILRGHDGLSRPGSLGDLRVSAEGSLPDDPNADRLVVECPAILPDHGPAYRLLAGGSQVARYEPMLPFEPAVIELSPAESQLDASLGFGFALRDDRTYWMNGARPDARDPRSHDIRGESFEPPVQSRSRHPEENISGISSDDTSLFNSSRRLSIAELPRQEVVSIGELQHLVSARPNAVGNPWGGGVNAIFDQAFLSTVPRWAPFDPSDEVALANPYIELLAPATMPVPLGSPTEVSPSSSAILMDRDHAAEFLLVRGAFNLNSTSAEAWTGVLGGMNIADWGHGATGVTHLNNAHFRFAHTAQHFSADPYRAATAVDACARGVRTLSREQVVRMAESVVRSIRMRGVPFTTIADFSNSGVLEQAIADAGINAELPMTLAGSPAWLSQADILSAIAPFIVVRSDTFVIRCYGDVRNPVTGGIEARSWCEAVVQRIPKLRPPADGNATDPHDVIMPDPLRYPTGRAFVVTGFRWLGPSDI